MTFKGRQGEKEERYQPPVQEPVRSEPVQRDEHGRFVGSGNPRGRPRKEKELLLPPTSMAAAAALILRERIKLREGGVTKTMTKFQVIAMRLVHDAMTGNAADRQRSLRSLIMMNAFAGAMDIGAYLHELRENAAPVGWTDELEEKYRVIEGMFEGADDEPAR